MEEITEAINRQLEAEFGGAAKLRYIDFDSKEMAEYPSVEKKVKDGSLQPGAIEIEGNLLPIYTVSYPSMIEEFERLGATRISEKAS